MTTDSHPQRFTPKHLQVLQQLQYKPTSLVRLLSERVDLGDDFHRHLLRIALPPAMRFDRMMRATGGNPIGREYKHRHREAWAFVLRDAGEAGAWRIQYFDRNAFSGHFVWQTMLDAAEALVSEGFTKPDDGVLDRLSGTAQWERGMYAAALIQLYNRKLITMDELHARRNRGLASSQATMPIRTPSGSLHEHIAG